MVCYSNYKKGGRVMGEKTCVARGLIMTLLLFTVYTFFVMPVYATEEKVSVIRATARALIDEPLQQLAENAKTYEAYLDRAADFLPEDSVTVLNEVLSVAQLDISPDEKGDAVIEIAQSNCLILVEVWLIGLILDYVSLFGTLASLLTDIGILGLLLCLLGLI
jgi:hypothetical protein